ncbi:MAG: N-acetyl-alpha-D-glucosaminyl L-malate synthase BshA [Candidatus Sumerlaeaceae bacterium]|nr:N-acetyl-alpha-D-glucosaminyl L-malate synthase BshA [Candidatus Sumerlaeaceae bacterium]
MDALRVGIACFASYGGSGVVATELGRVLARKGHKVHFISSEVPFRLDDEAVLMGNVFFHEVTTVTYDALPAASYGLEMASKIIQIATDEKLDLIHAHYAVPHAISGIVAKQVLKPRDLKIVTTLHGTDITLVGRAPSFFPLTKWAIENSDAVTTVSAWLRERTFSEFNVCVPVHVVHNFIDTDRFRPGLCPQARRQLAAPDEKIILHISNFRPVKRLTDVIEVFARVTAEVPSRLVLIGDGPERERALDLARELGVLNRTYFLGKQTMIERYFALADVFLFPSEYESFGVAALEAMSAEVPVVATTGSGLSEVVVEGRTGFLRPVGDVSALAEAVLTLLRHEDLRREMGRAGRKRATCCFRAEAIRERYESIYRAVLDGAPLPEQVPCNEAESPLAS